MVRMLFIAHLLTSVLFEWAGANVPLIYTEATECESLDTNYGYFCLWTLLSPSEFSEKECYQTSSIVVGFLYLVQLFLTYACKCRVKIQFVILESSIYYNCFFPSSFSCNNCLKASFLFYHYHFTQLNIHCSIPDSMTTACKTH